MAQDAMARATSLDLLTSSPHHPSLSGLSNATLARLAKLGIRSQFDLVLHLPLRYDDETRLYALSEAPPGQPVLVEGAVVECDIQYRPRRQLVCHIEDGSGVLTLRFFNFYQSQLKQLAAGARVRAFGEIRHGFLGPEMVHPRYRLVQEGTPVARALTPVYPTTAGLAQDALRRLIAHALADCDLDGHAAAAAAGGPGAAAVPRMRCCCCTTRRRAWRGTRCRSGATRRGAGSSSTSCWRSNSRCACTTARRKAAGAPALRPRGQARPRAAGERCRSS